MSIVPAAAAVGCALTPFLLMLTGSEKHSPAASHDPPAPP
jgi:hypothetical protein